MALDLSGLDAAAAAPSPAPSTNGKPLRASPKQFYEDPHQPRTEFDPAALDKFAEDLKVRGVMSAIIVHPPGKDGRMMIRHGARRFRGSLLAKLNDIPYVIEEDDKVFDDYSQVAENVQRENLTPMELAKFVEKRLKAGDKKGFIARNIGIHDADITYLGSLTRAPSYITGLYQSGKCRTPKYLYELENLAKKHPDEVEAFCTSPEEVTRKSISALSVELLSNTKKPPAPLSSEVGNVATGSGEGMGSAGSGSQDGEGSEDDNIDESSAKKTVLPFHNPGTEKGTGKPTANDPAKIKKPLLLGKVGKREVQVLLYKRPSGAALVHIKYEDGSGEDEIEFSTIKHLFLTEASA